MVGLAPQTLLKRKLGWYRFGPASATYIAIRLHKPRVPTGNRPDDRVDRARAHVIVAIVVVVGKTAGNRDRQGERRGTHPGAPDAEEPVEPSLARLAYLPNQVGDGGYQRCQRVLVRVPVSPSSSRRRLSPLPKKP